MKETIASAFVQQPDPRHCRISLLLLDKGKMQESNREPKQSNPTRGEKEKKGCGWD